MNERKDSNERSRRLRDHLSRLDEETTPPPGFAGESPEQGEQAGARRDAETVYWRRKYEQERVRLGKLWVAYKDLEAEVELRKEEAEAIAQRRAFSILGEQAQSGLLALEAPDAFEALSEAPVQKVAPGQGTTFPITLTNRTNEEVDVALDLEETEGPWSFLLTVDEVTLEPHSARTVYLIARVPEDVEPGETGGATVRVQPPEGEAFPMRFRAEIVEPEAPAEEAPLEATITGEEPDIVLEEVQEAGEEEGQAEGEAGEDEPEDGA